MKGLIRQVDYFAAIVLLAVASLGCDVCASQPSTVIQAARTRCVAVNELIAKGKSHVVRLVKPDGAQRGVPKWQVALSDAALERSSSRAAVYLSSSGRVLKLEVDIDSPSGDWSSKQEFYYDNAEKAIFSFRKYTTFQAYDYKNQRELLDGPYVVEERLYMKGGEIAERLERAYIESSGRPIDIGDVRVVQTEVYMDAQDLPFYKKLR